MHKHKHKCETLKKEQIIVPSSLCRTKAFGKGQRLPFSQLRTASEAKEGSIHAFNLLVPQCRAFDKRCFYTNCSVVVFSTAEQCSSQTSIQRFPPQSTHLNRFGRFKSDLKQTKADLLVANYG